MGIAHSHQIELHRWQNAWLLMRHIHYLKYRPEAFEETVKMEIDLDLREELIQSLERNTP
jgi:hypothetical protein